MSLKSWFIKHVNSLLVKYIQNIDPKHSNLAITSGQLVMSDLIIRQSVITELLPAVQVVYGRIGKLKIVLPSFVHFSTSIWEIEVSDLFILLESSPEEEYDEVQERSKIQAQKQKQLAKIESVRKKIREGVKKQRFQPITSLVEKFVMRIIRNVVVNVKGAHVRFEDKITHPECPIAVGITLNHILVESNKDKFMSVGATADEVEEIPKAFKVVTIQSLAIYWNYYSKLYRDLSPELLTEHLRDDIATTQYKPKNYTYILEPIYCVAKLKLNLRPDKDKNPFVIPKVTAYWEVPPFEISINKQQYVDAISLADYMAFMARSKPYRKFRPNVPYKGHYKEWWHFAYNCILESQVRRKINNFNWKHISAHLRRCKEYGELYKLKLQSKKLAPHIETYINKLEEVLDLMNIILVRQKVLIELEMIVKNKGKFADRLKDRLSRSNKEDKEPKIFDLVAMIRTMTPAEKDLFYQEIDYNENIPDITQPKEYTDIIATLALKKFVLKLHNNNNIVLLAKLSDISANLAIRTSANAISMTGKIKGILVTGIKQGTYKDPILISNNPAEDGSLCDVSFAMNPLNSNITYKLHTFLRPIQIIYDAITVNSIIDFVTIPRSSTLQQLSNVASSAIHNVKFQSSAKLQYIIDNHSQIDLAIDVWAPYVIIPFGGHYTGIENVIALNLGHVLFLSIEVKRSTIKEKQQKYTQQMLIKVLIEESYDKFMLKFTDFQVVIVPAGENWLNILKRSPKTVYHILYPLTLNVEIDICIVDLDPRLPRVVLNGILPSLSLNIIDYQLIFILGLINSIPFPQKEETSTITRKESQYSPNSDVFNVSYKNVELAVKDIEEANRGVVRHPQHTSLEIQFVLSEINVNLKHQENFRNPVEDVARICLELLSLTFKNQTYTQELTVELQNIVFNSYHKSYEVPIIVTPKTFFNDRVFEIKYLKCDQNSPDFVSIYKSTEILLSVEIEVVKVKVHQEVIQNLMKYATVLDIQIDQLNKKIKPPQLKTTVFENKLKKFLNKILSYSSEAPIQDNKSNVASRGTDSSNIIFQLKASLQEFQVTLGSDLGDFTSLEINSIMAQIILKKPYVQVSLLLKNFDIKDLSLHTKYYQIIKVLSKEVLNFNFFYYNKFLDTSRREDMAVSVFIGHIQIVLLTLYITKLVDFANVFTKTRQAIIKASKAAAVKAKQNVTNIIENAIQILITVDLKAPKVFIPEKSTSLYCLMCDLGQLTIRNEFLNFDIRNENTGSGVVIDEMVLKLSQVHVSMIQTNKKLEIRHGVTILKPFNFVLKFKRNLSSSWYKSIPKIQFKGYLKAIEIELGQTEYGLAIATVLGNLSEMTQHTVVSSSEIKPNQVNVKTKKIQFETPDIIDEVTMIVKFSLVMDKFTIKLFSTDDYQTNPRLLNAARSKLAQLSFEEFCIKGRILSDDSIYVSVTLVDCILKDIRTVKEVMLNTILAKSYPGEIDSDNASYKSMIDVIFQKKIDHIYVDLKVSEFTLNMSMEFVLQLQSFLMTLLPEEFLSHPNTDTIVAEQNVSHIKITKSSNQIQTEQFISATVNAIVEKPNIVLVENLNSIDTNAIIINFEVLVKLCRSNNKTVINGLVKDIQMYTCCYNPTQRERTKQFILYPFTVNIAGSTPEGKGLHVEAGIAFLHTALKYISKICLTEIRIKISPATTQLVNRVYSARLLIEQEKSKLNIEDETFEDMFDLWAPKPYNEKQYWFFNTSVTEDAIEYVRGGLYPFSFEGHRKEMCVISVTRLVLTVEIGKANAAKPILMLESCFEGNIRDWSADMAVDSTITLQMAYYNSKFAAWEPLIEPNATFHENVLIHQPWELKLGVSKYREDASSLPFTHYDGEIVLSGQPKMSVIVSSNTNLEMTMSKATLEVLTDLGQEFSNMAKLTTFKPPQLNNQPYKIINRSGLKMKIDCEKSQFHVYQQVEEKEVIMENGVEVVLQLKESDRDNYSLKEILGHLNVVDKRLYIMVMDMQCKIELSLAKPDTRYFSLHYQDNRDVWGIAATMLIEETTFKVILSSIVKVYNHLHLPINVYCMTPNEQEKEFIGSIEPEETFYLPVNAVYTPTCELFFSVQKYSLTTKPFVWKYLYLKVNQVQILQCLPTTLLGHSEPFVIKTISNIEQIYNENTPKRTMNSILYNIHVHPAVLFRNYLPYNIIVSVQNIDDEFVVEPGCTLPITNGFPGVSYIVVRIPDYLDKEWSSVQDIPANPTQFSVWTFDCYDSTLNVSLDLGVHSVEDKGPLLMTLYCPFWMLNKSELNIAYKCSDETFNVLHHPVNFKGPILFSFNAKKFFGTSKTAIRIEYGGEWSDKFSIDVAGSSGVITCKYDNKFYQFGVNIVLTSNGLTKQVTFTPYYVVVNKSPFPLECQEHDRPGDAWTIVQPNSCAALWPVGDFDDKLLRMRVFGTNEISSPFYFSDSHNTVLKLANKYGGIYVDVQITEGAVYITFAKYEPGMAIVLIINNTRNTLNIWEKDTVQLLKLDPGHQMLYSWSNPSRARIICWEAGYKSEIEDDLRKDGYGDYEIAENNHVYWTSFLDGLQRTLLFTCNPKIARNTRFSEVFANIDEEVTISIFGLGLSIVNNQLKKEIMYIAIAGSGVIWESCKHDSYHYKHMRSKESAAIESSYKQYLCMKSIEPIHGKVVVDSKTEVNFENLIMLKPHMRKIRRTFLNGLWIQITTNPYTLQLHAKINKVQIDNQSYDCIFPVVLAPVSLPKSVAGSDIHKPFAELSIVEMLVKHSQVKQFKYFKLLIQEFHINLELGFVMALLEVFQTSRDTLEKQKVNFLIDTELVNIPLYKHVSQQFLQEQKSFYDLLHFSPLKIHVSFSLGSGLDMAPNVVTVLLQSLGVTLTDMQDVTLKIAYFERECTFLTRKQLISEAAYHYIGQALKQLYAFVLGLDVLGNPYGLVLGITKGVEDFFYEPFQGAIQGPGEFVEGLALGVRNLVGYTVGGAAGAVSRITGAMGKGVAVLTFDKEFQRKRRSTLARKATVSQGFARSGKGLFMGLYHGVTGIVRKPISGAKEKGISGFFRGLGKGAVGLLARPTTGFIDFASGSLNTVKQVADLRAQEVNRIRPSRYIYLDGIIRPYNELEAIGNKILIELEKGKFASTDVYLHHFSIVGKKEILMLTDQRLLYGNRNDLFGTWQATWSYTWNEINMPPKVVPKGVLVMSAEQKKKKALSSSADYGKTIVIHDSNIAEIICLRIIEVYNTHSS